MAGTTLSHAALARVATAGEHLLVGGMPVATIAERVGRTPFYAYDAQAIALRISELRSRLPTGVQLHYAMKANPMPAVLRQIAPLVDGIDVASAGEMQIALDARITPKIISFAGPGKTDAELAQAAAAGIVINIESEREMHVLAGIAGGTKSRPHVAIRVNPDFELKSSGMKMGGGPKQFGVDAERVPEMLRALARLPLEFVGFHIFSGSQNLRVDSIIESQQKAVALAIELARHAPAPVRHLNIGGGFGIPYFPGEQPLDLQPIGANLHALLDEVRRVLPEADLILELGRYIVGEAGVYVCQIIDRKISRNQVFLITNGGLHHHLAASGNFGQVIRKNYPLVVANRMQAAEVETASVVGPLCTPLDLLGDRVRIPRAEIGDFIAVLQSGAYGLTASPIGFLSHPPPAEILV